MQNFILDTNAVELLNEYFRGKIENQLIGKDCKHISAREENFFTLSLEIKNKSSIEQSLDMYVAGELLEGDNKYMCSVLYVYLPN